MPGEIDWSYWDCRKQGHAYTDGKDECLACGQPQNWTEIDVMEGDPFNHALGLAMRQGQPGVCVPDNTLRGRSALLPRRWHSLEAEAVEDLRAAGTGGLARCVTCDKWIYVPGRSDAGIVVRGRGYGPGMNGVQL